MNAETPNRIPWPPLIFATAVVAGLIAQWITPVNLPAGLTVPGFVLLAAGLSLDVWAMWTMFAARTNILPHRAADSLVMHGPFAFMRNPIYVGNTIATLGLALALQNGWLLAAAAAAAAFTHQLAVVREEAHLKAKFGKAWDDYAKRVKRWWLV
ncbi:MAG: isoprenylcysteine carboxylmethyltransferase family protein [Anderseniella sp.]|jgi:protein-S-isoprenylcysteine O-methyltransferase Ste14|nr:isoprenylcysteine carboxylmethyltransferase family protein [Anderseniella sp.]